MKLRTGLYCDIRNVEKETFDAMVAVAHASGFDVLNAGYDYDHLCIKHDGSSNSVKGAYGENYVANYKEISVTDWLFSLAPDWATEVIKCKFTGWYGYSDGMEKRTPIGDRKNPFHHEDSEWKLIATRKLRNTVKASDISASTVKASDIKPAATIDFSKIVAKSKERDMVTLKMTDLPLPVHFRGVQQPISPAPPAVQAPRVRLGLFEIVYEDSNVMVLVNEQNANYHTIIKDWGITINRATEADIKIFNQLYRLGVADLNEHHYEALKALHELGE